MTWKVIDRKIGRAGSKKRREAQQREWDIRYGEGNWAIGYIIDSEFIDQEQALELVYYRSYEHHFDEHPSDLDELINTAKCLRNPHAEATTSVDLQVPAINTYLLRKGLKLMGNEVVDIGTWQAQYSHPISVRLSPLTIKCCIKQKMTLENFWQSKKCLAIWQGET